MNFTNYVKKDKFVVGIDPSGNGTTGIYSKWKMDMNQSREFKIELKAENEIEAAALIIEELKRIEKEVGSKIDWIGVEKVIEYSVSFNKNKMIPMQVRQTDRLDAILAATFGPRYRGIRPDWKSQREYERIKSSGAWSNLKKSEHIVDAKLIFDRTKDIFYRKKSYYDYKGVLINENI